MGFVKHSNKTNSTMKINNYNRMDIYTVDLRGGNVGSEQSGDKPRPCVVIQNDMGNKFSPTTIIAPFSTSETKAKIPAHTIVEPEGSGLLESSLLLCEQIRTVDEYRLIEKVGRIVDEDKIFDIERALVVSLGLQNYVNKLIIKGELIK